MEQEIARTVATSAVLVPLAHKVLGPTAQYLGGELKEYVQKGLENTNRMFEKAARFLDQRGNPDGAVSPRALKSALGQGYFCEDELVASYLGGALASSKSTVPRDDRAVFYLSLIESLSVYQIRTHYILYSAILRIEPEQFRHVHAHLMAMRTITIVLLDDDYVEAMDFRDDEDPTEIIPHCFAGLETKGLSRGGEAFMADPKASIQGLHRYFYPTELGIQLFLWGIGQGNRVTADFTPELLSKLEHTVNVVPRNVDLAQARYN